MKVIDSKKTLDEKLIMEADRQINLAKEMMDKYNIMFDQAISIIDKCSMIKEECEKFDQVFGRIFYNSVIEYGIIKGNNQILFIKPGQDGSLQGYKNKYYNLAKYVNEKYGFTVICSNNPYKKPYNPIDDAYEVIKEYIRKENYDSFEIYYFGNSIGALLGARHLYEYKEVKRALLINPPMNISYHKTKDGIVKFKGEKIAFVFGSLDPSSKYVELLDLIKDVNLEYHLIEGEDHNLSKNTVTLENLVDKYMM